MRGHRGEARVKFAATAADCLGTEAYRPAVSHAIKTFEETASGLLIDTRRLVVIIKNNGQFSFLSERINVFPDENILVYTVHKHYFIKVSAYRYRISQRPLWNTIGTTTSSFRLSPRLRTRNTSEVRTCDFLSADTTVSLTKRMMRTPLTP